MSMPEEEAVVRREKCRVCGTILTRVIDLGKQHIQGAFIKDGQPEPSLQTVPMSLGLCECCSLLQLDHSVNRDLLYKNYWYRSGTNRTMRDHLAELAAETLEISGKVYPTVLDIGSNDGTLMRSYPENARPYGIDPSNNCQDGRHYVLHDFFPSFNVSKAFGAMKFDIITSIAMFYDVEDPVTFAKAVKALLAPDGIWVIEVAYLPDMLKNGTYDTICAEHLEYYSLHSLMMLLMWANLWAFRASHNEINGGSVRIYVTHSDRFNSECVKGEDYQLLHEENLSSLQQAKTYLQFQDRIDEHRWVLQGLLRSLKAHGDIIHAYGASTKGNTILQWCNLDNSIIDYAADRNPNKHGARTLGSNIPIISEEASRAMKPDYYLVLPWHFKKEFIERERETIMAGTPLIFPFPEIEIVDKNSL